MIKINRHDITHNTSSVIFEVRQIFFIEMASLVAILVFFRIPRTHKFVRKPKQECIPVGCVPPASVAISGGGVCPGRVSTTHPCGQTDTCVNIILPQTLLAGSKNIVIMNLKYI